MGSCTTRATDCYAESAGFVGEAPFSAEGTWIPADPKERAAYQSETRLDCEKRPGTCVEATADYFSGHPHISLEYFQIESWDRNGIIAMSSEPTCVTRTPLIRFAAKHISDAKELKALARGKEHACQDFGVSHNEI